MTKSDADFGDVSVHCELAGVFVIIPFKVNTRKLFPFPICSYCVVLLECLEEVLCMLAACVLDPKVFHNEDTDNWFPLVSP